MTLDYDLVVIGGTRPGIEAAITAAKLQARVALVQPPQQAVNAPPFYEGTGPLQTAELFDSPSILWGAPFPKDLSELARALAQSTQALASLGEERSPAVLASLGIDVIAEAGEFICIPQLTLDVKTRRLISRHYLLAPSFRSAIPDIPGLATTGYLTRETFHHFTQGTLPNSIAIIGSDPNGIELAQILVRLGIAITLITSAPQILPKEDPEAAQLIQAQLEADGILVLTDSPVMAVKSSQGKKIVQTENRAIACDEIFIACGFQSNIDGLNLENVGVKFYRTPLGQRVQLNAKLQTTNPRIYGCGNLAGGYPLVNVARHEAEIAVKNALFFSRHRVNYGGIPWAFQTYPEIARVGLTEPQAKARYDDVIVLRQYFKGIAGGRLQQETTGFCKVLVRKKGEILGAHILGPGASELIHSFALGMQNNLKVEAIATLPHIWPSLSEINQQTAQLWQEGRFKQNTFWQNLLDIWFNWRR
ncbi:dihydrolipoyl dehydrogenase family protein [Laspinema palackyanum]|uniref:dihydrolipoyl dehydrogenase family protein n=1 Tax=Laspinema palackyanum TaxID=3231601 RepID=UPI00345DC53E|nr:NAD(P)/FAD-dependent oxidoreductase [Laspinema sp. D2c]